MKTGCLNKIQVPLSAREVFLFKVNDALAEWDSETPLEAARLAVKALHQQPASDRQQAPKRWAITAENRTNPAAHAQPVP